MASTIHIVQRMAPGGIESIVLDLARLDPETRVISLEGSRQALVEAWPSLAPLGDRLEALAKPEGCTPGCGSRWSGSSAGISRRRSSRITSARWSMPESPRWLRDWPTHPCRA